MNIMTSLLPNVYFPDPPGHFEAPRQPFCILQAERRLLAVSKCHKTVILWQFVYMKYSVGKLPVFSLFMLLFKTSLYGNYSQVIPLLCNISVFSASNI